MYMHVALVSITTFVVVVKATVSGYMHAAVFVSLNTTKAYDRGGSARGCATGTACGSGMVTTPPVPYWRTCPLSTTERLVSIAISSPFPAEVATYWYRLWYMPRTRGC